MKNLFLLLSVLFCMSCATQEKKNADAQNKESKNIKDMNFEELFTGISAEEISDNVFKLVGKDITVITSGKDSAFNSMAASWGGVGILFNRPATWCMLRANRYTLEIIKTEHTYTLSYFPEEYKEQVLFFGSKSGRNSNKMKETTLTSVQTPSGNMTYKEARLVFECKLTELTTTNPDDFFNQEDKDFIMGGFEEAKEYHKLVFGEITNIWIKK